jgi:threonyl-tRNA synthetase
MALPEKAPVESTDYKPLETVVNSIVKDKQVFERLELSKDDL